MARTSAQGVVKDEEWAKPGAQGGEQANEVVREVKNKKRGGEEAGHGRKAWRKRVRGWTKQKQRPKSQGACQSVLEKAPRRSGRRPTKAQRRGPGGRKEGQAAEERNVQERCVLGQRKARMQHPRERWIQGGEKGRSPQKEPGRRGEKRTPRGTRGPTDQAGPHTATRAEAQGREPKWLRDLDAEKGSRVQGTAKEAKRGRGGQKGGRETARDKKTRRTRRVHTKSKERHEGAGPETRAKKQPRKEDEKGEAWHVRPCRWKGCRRKGCGGG